MRSLDRRQQPVGNHEKIIRVKIEVPEYSKFYTQISQIKKQRLRDRPNYWKLSRNHLPLIWTEEVDYAEDSESGGTLVKSNLEHKMKIQIIVETYEDK